MTGRAFGAVGLCMRRLMIAAALTAVVLPGSGAPAAAAVHAQASLVGPAAAGFNSCGYYPTTTVHLRTGPGTRYTSLGLVGLDDRMYAEKASGGWYRVTLSDRARSGLKSGTSGWVAKKYVRPAVCMRLNG